MNGMQFMMICPSCGETALNLFEYSSLMALRSDLGLFTIECPNCSAKTSSIHPIPLQLQKEVVRKAAEVNAGMGIGRASSDSDNDEGNQ